MAKINSPRQIELNCIAESKLKFPIPYNPHSSAGLSGLSWKRGR